MKVTNKSQMYDLLAKGEFGNTTKQFFSYREWFYSGDSYKFHSWGIRTLTPGGPFFPYVEGIDVMDICNRLSKLGYKINISPMVDDAANVTLWADVYDSPTGLKVYGIEYPGKGASWRALMPSKGRQWVGITSHLMLKKHLNESSYADLEALRDKYPGHVYELSALDRNLGQIPGRNAVIWEVRTY